ncbi:hypothetical protein [Pseudomonas knackmussii]|uniref:hypothetical protein n=1 Tax=Pseudomonas knackmussii TaxID=65741 RepID=UPI0005BCF9E8|nr:hypothetical protein [Pseudomonas knackmussii]
MSRRQQAHQYQLYRSEARKEGMKAVSGNPKVIATGLDVVQVHFTPITRDAIDASMSWGDHASLYPWEEVPSWKDSDLRGFDLAIWFGPQLCGLCYATPRRSTIRIKVILLEGRPDHSHPLRGFIASFSMVALDKYARIIGCTKIEIQDPAPEAVALYQELGFRYDRDGQLVIPVSSD